MVYTCLNSYGPLIHESWEEMLLAIQVHSPSATVNHVEDLLHPFTP